MEFLNQVELKDVVGIAHTHATAESVFCCFSVIVESALPAKDGSVVIDTQFFDCVYFPPIGKYTPQKGERVHVIGRLKMTRYTNEEGDEDHYWQVVARNVSPIAD